MTTAYLRYSTNHQDEMQQKFAIEEYAKQHSLTIDNFEIDEGVSGGVSYKNRKLYKIVKKMSAGDVLITTEISRLGRSMGDLNMFVSQELKPRKLRLIVVKMGLDLDCAKLKAVDEMIIFAFGFAAQCEKEMIQQRTQSAIDARKEAIRTEGGFMSKSGRWRTRLGNEQGTYYPQAVNAMAAKNMQIADEWRSHSPLYSWLTVQLLKQRPQNEILAEAAELYEKNPEEYSTRKGFPLSLPTMLKWKREILSH